MTTDGDYAWDDSHSELVALRAGPRDHRWLYYRDWIAARRASRRLRVPLDRHSASDRCYAPTTRFATRTDKAGREMTARVWTYVPPDQWTAWGYEYRTPDEQHDPINHQRHKGDVTSGSRGTLDTA